MYALRNVSDATSVTGRYLSALGFRGWLKLGAIVLLLGALGGMFQWVSAPFDAATQADPGLAQEIGEIWVGLLIGGVLLGIYLGVRYIGALCEFIFVESLRSEALSVRSYARANLRLGFWLLLFRIGLVLAVGVLAAALGAGVLAVGGVTDLNGLLSGTVDWSGVTTEQFVAMAIIGVVLAIGWKTLDTLTTGFVVPIMLLKQCGPLTAWMRFGSSMASNWAGILVFLTVAWTAGIVVWGFFLFVGFFVGFIGLFLFAFLAIALEAIHSSLAVGAFLLLIPAYVGYQYLVSLLEAPVWSYVRLYGLLLLGDTDADLDLIPDQRAAVRTAGEAVTGPTTEQSAVNEPSPEDGSFPSHSSESATQRGTAEVGWGRSHDRESTTDWEWGTGNNSDETDRER